MFLARYRLKTRRWIEQLIDELETKQAWLVETTAQEYLEAKQVLERRLLHEDVVPILDVVMAAESFADIGRELHGLRMDASAFDEQYTPRLQHRRHLVDRLKHSQARAQLRAYQARRCGLRLLPVTVAH